MLPYPNDGPEADAPALRLAQLMATRLCHDLAGLVGGVAAALGEVREDAAEALLVAEQTASVARRRLTLLRGAWGVAVAPLTGAALADLAPGLPHGHKLRLHLAPALAAATLPPVVARLALNLLLLAAESLPGGGEIALAGEPSAWLALRIAGHRAAWPDGFGDMLAEPAPARRALALATGPAAARRLQAGWTSLLLHAAGVRAVLAPEAGAALPVLHLDLAVLERAAA
jgi:histidine phosphotransferase ChpT